jgi:type I restriction enzyme S subunit
MVESIIQSFDIWIDAQGLKSKGRVKSVENISLEGIARLRELILELAVSGKLVAQDINDEPASELLKRVEKERDRSDTPKKKKKEVQNHSGNIFLFEIPGWKWCKLDDIGTTNIGLTYSPKDISNSGTIVLRSSNIQNGEIELSDIVRVDKSLSGKVLVKQGDLLICARNGSKKLVGKCALIRNLLERMAFGAFMAIFRSAFNEYIRIFIESPIYRRNLEGVTTTTINQITQDNLMNTYIPLPPLAEQLRIVAKVDELMALCNKLEEQQTNNLKTHQLLVKTTLETITQAADANDLQAAWERMASHFDTQFCTEDSIDQLKQTILQLAVMGKLVKQDTNDEPASELLKKIAKRKDKLVKEGKIKKQTPVHETLNEKPYALEEGWIWCKLEDIGYTNIGLTYSPKDISNNGTIVLRSSNIQDGEIELTDIVRVEKSMNNNVLTKQGDLLICARNGSRKLVGKCALIRNLSEPMAFGAFMAIFRSPFNEYIKIFIESPVYRRNLEGVTTTTINQITQDNLKNTIIPLPPRAEQNRIKNKVDELFTFCEALKENIIKAEEIKVQLAEAVVEGSNAK